MWINIEEFILYEDKEVLICHKPAGLAVQTRRIGVMDMESALKNILAKRTPGKEPYLGVVHRLDQPVEGLLVFAKTPRAAGELGRQISQGKMCKEYLAVTRKKPRQREGLLEDYLKKDGKNNCSQVVKEGTPGGKKACLRYQVLESLEEDPPAYLLKIILDTGRHHQIRVQMAHAGMALVGDRKYGEGEGRVLGLCAAGLTFFHPGTKKEITFRICPKGEPFLPFSASLEGTGEKKGGIE